MQAQVVKPGCGHEVLSGKAAQEPWSTPGGHAGSGDCGGEQAQVVPGPLQVQGASGSPVPRVHMQVMAVSHAASQSGGEAGQLGGAWVTLHARWPLASQAQAQTPSSA
jgi:hypothetical protein